MFSGVVSVEFRSPVAPHPERVIRVLVRNVTNMHEAMARGVSAAIELQAAHGRETRPTIVDWVRCDFDIIA